MSTSLVWIVYAGGLAAALAAGWRYGLPGLFLAHVFFVPWFGLQVNLGLTINVDRVIAAALLALTLLRFGPRGLAGWGLFAAYAALDTVAQSLTLPPDTELYSALRGQWRWLFQLPVWGLMIAPGALATAAGNRRLAQSALDVLVLSAGGLAILGLVQAAVYLATGADIFPVGVIDPWAVTRTGLIEAERMGGGRMTWIRMGSLAGEPKHLAYVVMVAATILLADQIYGGLLTLSRSLKTAVAVVCVVALVGTFSTQGLVLGSFNVAAMLATAPKSGRTALRRYAAVGVALVLLFVVTAQVAGLHEVLLERTVGRLRDQGGIEDWNQAVMGFLRETPWVWPFGVGLGNVHLYAAPYIPLAAESYMVGQVFVAKSGLLRLLSELGLAGLGLFLAAYLAQVLRALRHRDAEGARSSVGFAALGMVLLVDFLVSGDGPVSPFLFAGLCTAACRQDDVRRPEVLRA